MTDCDNPNMAAVQHQILDVVELKVDSGRWPAGTIGTVVEADADQALVEISDDRGHGLDFVSGTSARDSSSGRAGTKCGASSSIGAWLLCARCSDLRMNASLPLFLRFV